MISIEQIRNNVENVRKQLSLKGDTSSIDTIVSLDESYRSHISKSNELRAKRNKVSEEIAAAKKSGKSADQEVAAMRQVGDEIKLIEQKANEIKNELDNLLLFLPNLPHKSTPVGKDNTDNKLVRECGEEIKKDIVLKTHHELVNALG